jgi:hypothetical protein
MKPYRSKDAVELANRLQDVVRSLPPDTHPHTIMMALCAVMAQQINLLEPADREVTLAWAIRTVTSGVEINN